MAETKRRRAEEIANDLWPAWYKAMQEKRRTSRDGRTGREQDFDSGVFAASELVRRLTKDEDLALAIHSVCFWSQRERKAVKR
jgi:hypothetical protein